MKFTIAIFTSIYDACRVHRVQRVSESVVEGMLERCFVEVLAVELVLPRIVARSNHTKLLGPAWLAHWDTLQNSSF